MKNYLIFSLTLAICFPSLFSYFTPLFILAFAYEILIRPQRLANAIEPKIILGFGVMLIAGAFLVLVNLIKFNDASPWTYWIAGFLIWALIVVLIRSTGSPAEIIHKSLLCSSLFVGSSCLIYVVLFILGILPDPVSFVGYQAYFGIDDRGFFAYSTTNVPHIPYLVAYLAVYGTLSKKDLKPMEITAIILLTISGILSLRSFVFISFLGLAIYCAIIKNKLIAFATAVAMLLVIGIFVYQNSESAQAILDGIYNLKWSEKVSGEDIRYKQLVYWLESFLDSPWFGHGLSSVRVELYDIATGELQYFFPGPIDAPFGYEIYYGKLLSDIGLFFIFYISIFFWLSFMWRSTATNNSQIKALRVSAVVMILQSATNSYLGTSGWMFILMLPMTLGRSDGFSRILSKMSYSQRLNTTANNFHPSLDEAVSKK